MGNMIGSGVFLLPASLAAYRGLSLVGWVVSAAGSVCLAMVFARLAAFRPASGGPYAYTRQAYGDLAGFLVAWGYWISIWTANAALAVAFVGYLDPFIPSVVRNPLAAASLAVGMVWLLTAVNCRGTLGAGRVQTRHDGAQDPAPAPHRHRRLAVASSPRTFRWPAWKAASAKA